MICKYSVLMSVYCKESPINLKESINSMINQTIKPDEIIIVEDGPLTDSLYVVIDEYIKKYNNIFNIIKLNENKGLGAALNIGIDACKNELIARMDTDDIAFPNRCEKQLIKFEQNPNLVIVGTQILEFKETVDNIVSKRIVPCSFNEIKRFAKKRSPFNHPTVMYKKSEIVKHKGYSEYGRKEDLDLFLRLVFDNCYSENLDESLLYYRTSELNIKRRKSWINCSEYIEIMFHFYKDKKISLLDFLYVFFGQLIMYVSPIFLLKFINNRLLRETKKKVL